MADRVTSLMVRDTQVRLLLPRLVRQALQPGDRLAVRTPKITLSMIRSSSGKTSVGRVDLGNVG